MPRLVPRGLALPRLALPRLALPRLALPRLALSRLALSRLALPRRWLHRLALTRARSVLALAPLLWPAVGEEPRGGEAIAWVTLIAALLAAGLMWWRLGRRA